MKHLLHLILFLAIGLSACSQPLEPIDPNYYGAPVKIPVFLAGNFAELRSNHFHAGIDIKTQGRTGISVYSAADGFISRISISPSGYGNALYIDHPNGTTTVYGHLSSFSSPVEDYIRKIQYEKEEFTINQFVPEGMFPVKKGEQIAKSGNSGSSGGPHLHFEIRRTKEEIILNPLLFHMPVKDKTKPTIQALMVYPVSDDASVSGSHTSKRFETLQAGSAWKLKTAQTIPVYGKIGFGLQTIDFFDGVPNKCGIYSLKLTVDDQLIYSFTMDDLVMEESKYINSHTDYAQAIRTGKRVYRTWVEPGNKLSIYDTLEQRGIFTATDGQIHQVNYEVSDVYGNTTSLAFAVQAQETGIIPSASKGELFKYNRDNRIRNEELEFSVPLGALYDNIDFEYEKKPALPKFYSPVYQLHNSSVALHFACPLRIKAGNLPAELQNKVMLAQIDPVSGKIYSATGKYDDGWVEGNIRLLGDYALAVDTVAPKIISLSIADQSKLNDANRLRFKLSDNLSGIETYRGTIDGNWVLFEYDLKNNLISYTFDQSRLQFNKNHSLNLVVTDYKGNTSTYKANFYK
ncbi:MAG TPA: M23 family metallopeptidase [Prolixibacteraceae bacterium]|nr:M23 family metallopeptidase [Prolixibacteraceae bacterium]